MVVPRRWARDAGVFGLVVPCVVVAPMLGVVLALEGRLPPIDALYVVAYFTGVAPAVAAGVGYLSGLVVKDLEPSPFAWWVGFPAGVAAGCSACLAYQLYAVFDYRAVMPLFPSLFAFVGGCTAITAPTHALYLALVHRERSPLAALVVGAVLSCTAAPVALFGGAMVGQQLSRW